MKLLLALALTVSLNAQADLVGTGNVKFPFLSNGGWAGLCERVGWVWGYDTTAYGGEGSYACYAKRHIIRNGLTRETFIRIPYE